MRNRLTQAETIFYRLYTAFKDPEKRQRYIPVHEFMGELYCQELAVWGYVSYEVGARISEMYRDNPLLLDRQMITGKSGAKYYGYRITASPAITDQTLEKLRKRIANVHSRQSQPQN